MRFSELERIAAEIKDVLVIGRTAEHEGKFYYIIGMALVSNGVNLYIIEPYEENEDDMPSEAKHKNHREMLMKDCSLDESYLHCKEFIFGNEKIEVQSGSAGSLRYDIQNYEAISLFIEMMKAGWEVPEELKETDWEKLCLVTLTMADINKLPEYSKEMPITIVHDTNYKKCFVEKPVLLKVGKTCEFAFSADNGEELYCYINNVSLIDIWSEMEEQFNNPSYREKVTKEEFEETKKMMFETLEQNCPKGMYYINVEYECTKEIALQFYANEFLQSFPEEHNGSASSMFLRSKPEKDTGTHGLPLNSYIIQTPVSAETVEIPSELLFYIENIPGWEENVFY